LGGRAVADDADAAGALDHEQQASLVRRCRVVDRGVARSDRAQLGGGLRAGSFERGSRHGRRQRRRERTALGSSRRGRWCQYRGADRGRAGVNLLSRIRTLARIRPLPEGDLPEVAQTVAIIMDGNGRWARKRALPIAVGHRAGTKALRRTVEAAIDLGVRNLAVYAFSTENWSRPQDEVDALMEIFAETIERELPDLAEQGVRVRFIGRRDRAPEALRGRMQSMEDRTELNARLNLWIAFDYGGRAELVQAARRIAESGMDPREIDENVVAANLYAPELPDPDLLIRTSGELRISNFMLWQLAYAELVFVDRLWPDFEARDLRGAMAEYARRRRRFGGR